MSKEGGAVVVVVGRSEADADGAGWLQPTASRLDKDLKIKERGGRGLLLLPREDLPCACEEWLFRVRARGSRLARRC